METYYNVGKLLSDAGKSYGENIIKVYSVRLSNEIGKLYTYATLSRMRQFYLLSNVATVSQYLTYSHYVVVKLKITELKAEYIGQIKKYMNYIDKNFKGIKEDFTIGIIICKKDNIFVMEYCSDSRIFSKEYVLISSK